MKANLLTLSLALLFNSLTFGQDFTQAANNTGFIYNCDLSSASEYTWDVWMPDCNYSGGTGSGSIDPALTNELTFGFGQGSAGYAYLIFALTTPLDLSAAANQKVSFTLRNEDASNNPLPLTYKVHLESSSATLTNDLDVAVTGTSQTFTKDFSGSILSGQNLGSVKKIVIIYDACNGNAVQAGSHLIIGDFKAGSYVVTGINQAQSTIADSKIYPNPASYMATVQLDLKTASNVKVVLNDLLGKEIKVLAQGNYLNLIQTFDVTNLGKGMYTIAYFIDNALAKTETLLVR